MAPPPPSKSYLLKFDDLSDTDNESDDDRNIYRTHGKVISSSTSVTPNYPAVRDSIGLYRDPYENNGVKQVAVAQAVAEIATNNDNSIVIEADVIDEIYAISELDRIVTDDEDEDDISDDEINEHDDTQRDYNQKFDDVKKKRKTKKGKKKKKKKKGGQNPTNTTSLPTELPVKSKPKVVKKLSFGEVTVTEFGRCLGQHVVPYDGGWPLGISDSVVSPVESAFTNDSETKGHNKNELSRLLSIDSSVEDFEQKKQQKLRDRWNQLKEDNVTDVINIKEPFETRQWDHKRKCKNPLFRLLNENERMQLLITQSSQDICVEESTTGHISNASRRTRSGSISDNSPPSPPLNKTKIRTRSMSMNEVYNDNYPQADVHAVRNELERIRNGRSAEDSTGCNCRKLQVYLMPTDGSGGKKANSRRMKLQQVKLELRKRQLLPTEPKTREELELLLHNTVENEPCCSSDDCPCAHNGIECQVDACTCWYLSHQTTEAQRKQKENNDAELNVTQIQSRCGNKFGMYAVDTDAIEEFRKKYVYCHAVTI